LRYGQPIDHFGRIFALVWMRELHVKKNSTKQSGAVKIFNELQNRKYRHFQRQQQRVWFILVIKL